MSTETRTVIVRSRRFKSYRSRLEAGVRSTCERGYSVSGAASYWDVSEADLWSEIEKRQSVALTWRERILADRQPHQPQLF